MCRYYDIYRDLVSSCNRKENRKTGCSPFSGQYSLPLNKYNDKLVSVTYYSQFSLQIARAWQVPPSTLHRRVTGIVKGHTHQMGRKPIFSAAAEQELADICIEMAKRGFPLTEKDVRSLAYEYAARNVISGFSQKKGTAGYYWLKGFLRRHPELSVKKPEGLSSYRASGMNIPVISKWFADYRQLLEDCEITDLGSHIWNLDESGFQDFFVPNRAIGEVGKPLYQVTGAEKGETVTVLPVFNAVGDFGPLMVIFKAARVKAEWVVGSPPHTLVRCSKDGYINKELFLEFGRHFISFLTQDTRKHVLLMDGHGSHVYNIAFHNMMKENNVEVQCLPAHTTHWMQPADKSLFKSMKTMWVEAGRQYTRETGGQKVGKAAFFTLFTPIWNKCRTVQICQNAFRATGIFPVNQNMIPAVAYNPSLTTDRTEPTTTTESAAAALPLQPAVATPQPPAPTPLHQQAGDAPMLQLAEATLPLHPATATPQPASARPPLQPLVSTPQSAATACLLHPAEATLPQQPTVATPQPASARPPLQPAVNLKPAAARYLFRPAATTLPQQLTVAIPQPAATMHMLNSTVVTQQPLTATPMLQPAVATLPLHPAMSSQQPTVATPQPASARPPLQPAVVNMLLRPARTIHPQQSTVGTKQPAATATSLYQAAASPSLQPIEVALHSAVSFSDLVALPTRQRSNRTRAKPPSSTLTSEEHFQYLSKKKTKNIPKTQKTQKTHKKAEKKATVVSSATVEGEDVCSYCQGAYGSSKVGDDWIRCNICSKWFHESCGEQSGILDDELFVCGNCI